MRILPARSSFLPGAAILGAVIWGAMEFFALQWARFNRRFRANGLVRTS